MEHKLREALNEIALKLRELNRYDVGMADEGDGYKYEYIDQSKDGRWVEWDDIEKLIDDCL